MAKLTDLKNMSEADRRMITDAESMLGPEPSELGFIKNLFWGRYQEEQVAEYPRETPEERRKCDALLERLDAYLTHEHPAIEIDRDEEIPKWAIDRLFEIGVMGMTVPEEHGGLGLGVTSYNRALDRIGATCGSTAVVVSAHQSIGCKAIMLFGNEEQQGRWLRGVATEHLSAFCLSEPNVGCDAGGQETESRLSEDGSHYILNGEKKWSTSGALSGLFTVISKNMKPDPTSGSSKAQGTNALVCTPDMAGITIIENNRSKCGIRGTWQARIKFEDVRVPVANLLHKEGKGLNVALTCLNYGRCTLSAGMLGSARNAMNQSVKWSLTRFQFGRPLSDFDLVKEKVARMSAYTYAMDAVLYMMTGMLDRHDKDIMVETAATKVFCSEMGWRVVNDALQIMGGEGYMTENLVERAFRDSRINLIVEGANEVMHSFIFAYGGKRLAEQMLGLQASYFWDSEQAFGQNIGRIAKSCLTPRLLKIAIPLGLQLFFGIRPKAPSGKTHPQELEAESRRFDQLISDLSHAFKTTSLRNMESMVTRQIDQARLSDSAIHLFAMSCVMSKIKVDLNSDLAATDKKRLVSAAKHFMSMADIAIQENIESLTRNADESMREAAESSLAHVDAMPNENFFLPEKSPIAAGTGRKPAYDKVKQFLPQEDEMLAALVDG